MFISGGHLEETCKFSTYLFICHFSLHILQTNKQGAQEYSVLYNLYNDYYYFFLSTSQTDPFYIDECVCL